MIVALLIGLIAPAHAQTCVIQATGSPLQSVLTWSYAITGFTGIFDVLRSASVTGPFVKINVAPIPGTTLTYTDATVSSSSTYYYEVIATANALPSTPSNIVCKTFITIPASGLTITLLGDGVGTVKSQPVGIDCPTTCTAMFSPTSQVQLTASSDHRNRFGGWSGGGCSGTRSCVTTIPDYIETIVALFTKK